MIEVRHIHDKGWIRRSAQDELNLLGSCNTQALPSDNHHDDDDDDNGDEDEAADDDDDDNDDEGGEDDNDDERERWMKVCFWK